ncbi:SCO family protein [Aliishimia ponticola]|uniref:SCO family protein n=1 Tax=Aliishimia ponticola TaxID=2499833 RepID=A0A4S4N7V3_9RHOB|nr:SCO family protein [Aliishimia ponticola]THH34625.1 SCO family protein [Aliishimia ponticola]
MGRTLAIAAVAAVIAGLGAAWYAGRPGAESQFAQCSQSASGSDIGGPFELVDTSGETVTDTDVFTEPSIVYFGYTFCPDVCPFDVSRNAEAVDILAERGISSTPVFITIDPERDTPEALADYEANMHDKMIALTGTPEQVAAASRAYKTYYSANKDGTDEYLVDHSTFTYLVLPEYGFVEFFRRDVTAEQMADRVACFVQNS